ncbi:MAG: FtsX-like permease family protein [Ruminococcaceae bacterium]|nr:FtsX-like permease family protein [Oscillospiraceae bacterium]
MNYGNLSGIFKSIKRGKGRSLLTLCSVMVGVFAVVVISGIGSVGSAQINSTMVTMGINSAMVQTADKDSTVSLTREDVTAFGRLQGVDKAMPLMSAMSQSVILEEYVNCYAWGVDEDAKDIISIEPIHGRLIDDHDVENRSFVCVIDEEIAKKTYGRSNIVGKKIKLLLNGSYYEFETVGIAKSGITGLQSMMAGIIPDFAYIPYTTMQDITGKSSFDKIALLLDSKSADEDLTETLTEQVNSIKDSGSSLVINNFQSQKGQLTDILSVITTVLSLIAGISLIVSGITVMTTMLVSVGERKREIGIKKSIGARSSDIMWEFLSESVLLTALGSAAGVVLALLCCFVGCGVLSVPFVVPVKAVCMAFGISVVMGAVFGAYPAGKAAGMKPIEALRS